MNDAPANSIPTKEGDHPSAFAVSKGSVSVRVYPLKSRGQWQVCWYNPTGARERKTFAGHVEAKSFARLKASELSRQETGVLTLTPDEASSYLAARRHLDPLGVPVHVAAAEFARRHPQNRPRKTVREVVDELLAEDKARGLSRAYQETQSILLGFFARAIVMPIAAVGPDDVRDYLASRPISAKSVLHERASIIRLFNFARRRNYLSRDQATEISEVPKPKVRLPEIRTITAAELSRLLDVAPAELLPGLALQAFAPLRTAEIARLDWADVRLVERLVVVNGEVAKMSARRVVPLPEVAVEWLRPLARPKGKLVALDEKDLARTWGELARKARIAYSRNALRHSCISAHVVKEQDPARVAFWAGNSARVIQQAYWARWTPTQGDEWFSVKPPVAEINGVALPDQQAA